MNDFFLKVAAFFIGHFDTLITVLVTILGFVITYIMTKKNFKDEIKKDKISLSTDAIKTLPYDICQMMDQMTKKKNISVEQYGAILSKVLAYGSRDAVKIVIKMQRLAYNADNMSDSERYTILGAYSLLITQLKFDLTSEIISPESWFQLRINDYNKIEKEMKDIINHLVEELSLSKEFTV